MRSSLCHILVLLVCFSGLAAAEAETEHPFGLGNGAEHLPDMVPLGAYDLTRRVPLTTSRVVGSPDPPPPYRVRPVLPALKLDFPLFVLSHPGTRQLLFLDQERSYARSRLCRTTDAGAGEFDVLLDLTDVAYSLALHPDFAKNGFLYVGSNGARDGLPKMSRVTRYTMQLEPPYAVDEGSAKIIIEWESDGHNGAAIAFGLDGMLYVTSGDGTSDSDDDVKGQGLDHLLAKVLRIDVDRPAEGQAYAIPADNPFVGVEGARPETWAYGLRNPWRMTVDRRTGALWVGNNGQDLWEQAYRVERGANYGWSVYEGSHPFYLNRQLGPTPVSPPTVEHSHSESRSLTGGVVYYGSRFPELEGAYIYGDYSTGKIWGVKHNGKEVTWHRELADSRLQISGFGTDADGELLIVDHQGNQQGGLYTLETTPPREDPDTFPRRLSQSGLFQSVQGHRVHPALIPYSVNAPLWSDGALKARFVALPESSKTVGGEPPRINGTGNRGWDFPDNTVLVKSFALELEEGNPASRKWIETRLMTRQDGEWVGYSYRWNDEQTDAELVAGEGTYDTFAIRTDEGVRRQTWRYPSRTECMVCHSRAANYVLGLSTAQMNRDHDYGRQTRNQIDALRELGVLKTAEAVDELPRLVDPYSESADLNARARSYLHANCSVCHVKAGGGNAQIDLEFTADNKAVNMFDVPPIHHTFGIENARLVAAGDPDRSVLLHRVRRRGTGQMPQLATTIADQRAVQMLAEWIRNLPEQLSDDGAE